MDIRRMLDGVNKNIAGTRRLLVITRARNLVTRTITATRCMKDIRMGGHLTFRMHERLARRGIQRTALLIIPYRAIQAAIVNPPILSVSLPTR